LTATLAEKGQQFLDLLQAQGFDVILVNIQMLMMDGIEATKRMRRMMNAEQ